MQHLLHGVVKLQSWRVADHMDPQCLFNADAITVLLQSKLEIQVLTLISAKLAKSQINMNLFRSVEKKVALVSSSKRMDIK